MNKIDVVKNEVKYKIWYAILGIFVTLCSLGFSLLVWENIFFDRSNWLTRKNLLKFLQTNPTFKIDYYNKMVEFTLEDKSHIILWLDGRPGDWYYRSKEVFLADSIEISERI